MTTPVETIQRGEGDADCVIARCPDCKRVVYVAVNEPGVMADQSSKLLRKGYILDHMTVAEVRTSKEFGCRCE